MRPAQIDGKSRDESIFQIDALSKYFKIKENAKQIQVEEKEDYRFYFSNGVNYIIQFYTGTESFIQKTFNLKNRNPTSNKKTTILVLEHTATRNRFFYFNPKYSEKEDVLLSFLSN